MKVKLFISLLTLIVSQNAIAARWIACNCSDSTATFHRSCFSTTSCGICCRYSSDDPACKEVTDGKPFKAAREDHEGRNITTIEDGPRAN